MRSHPPGRTVWEIVSFIALAPIAGGAARSRPSKRRTEAFQHVSAYAFNVANLTGESFPEQIRTMGANADFFRLCGADLPARSHS